MTLSAAQELRRLSAQKRQEIEAKSPDCAVIDVRVRTFSDYVTACEEAKSSLSESWYRGQQQVEWPLVPKALRYGTQRDRDRALDLVNEFRLRAPAILDKAPGTGSHLEWLQLAQHYGLPTRLLDWTLNPAAALFFACRCLSGDGAVFVMDPVELNEQALGGTARVLDDARDKQYLTQYCELSGARNPSALPTVAMRPVWDSPRITQQRGAFTLHGSARFDLTASQAPSLRVIPILGQDKERLLSDLNAADVHEASLFPEPEHLCSYLMREAGL